MVVNTVIVMRVHCWLLKTLIALMLLVLEFLLDVGVAVVGNVAVAAATAATGKC